MQSLRNVGQIRYVINIPSNDQEIDHVADKIQAYDYQYAVESLSDIQKVAQNIVDVEQTEWQVMFDEREQDGSMALVRDPLYSPKIYAMILEKQNGIEAGITDMEPRKAWLEQAKESYTTKKEEREKQREKRREKKQKRRKEKEQRRERKRELREKPEKKRRHRDKHKKRNTSTNEKTIEKDKRIDSNISKSNLKILISARLANVLRAGEFNQDFKQIVDGYPELEEVLRNIFDPESLDENREKLPYELNKSEIEEIKQNAKFLKKDDDEFNLHADENIDLLVE